MVRAGVPERVAMTISGHKTRSVFERYNIVDENDLQLAAAKAACIPRIAYGHKTGHNRPFSQKTRGKPERLTP